MGPCPRQSSIKPRHCQYMLPAQRPAARPQRQPPQHPQPDSPGQGGELGHIAGQRLLRPQVQRRTVLPQQGRRPGKPENDPVSEILDQRG